MLDPLHTGFCSEYYEVEKTIEVVVSLWGEERFMRFDALLSRDLRPAYSAAAYLREDVTLTRSQPGASQVSFATAVWVRFPGFPSTARDSADEALAQALSFLRDMPR